MNLLKANYNGKVGQTVGAKWKDLSTLRTYSKPANPNTEAQQSVRNAFKQITSFVALFADLIKYKSALDTSGMSVRNAIIKLNKAMIASGTVTLNDLLISKGGLQRPISAAMTNTGGNPAFSWAAPTATNFTPNAKAVAVFVNQTDMIVDVVEADVTDLAAASSVDFGTTNPVQGYLYFIDKRGSNKVASLSVGANA